MGRRSRKGRAAGAPAAVRTEPAAPRPARRSSEERSAEVRAQLEPLRPGERPRWVTIAAIVAGVLAVANLALVAGGYEVTSGGNKVLAGIIGSALLGAAAIGMWRAKYWAVLGFEALLALTALQAFLSLLVASNVWGGLLAALVLGLSGFLFYKLIRDMARIQMPRRPGAADA